MMNKMSIKKDDQVVVITGKDKGQRGKVIAVMPKDGKVVVEGINMVSRHTRPRKQGEEGGIIKKEAAIDVSNVMLVCPKCKKGVRVGMQVLENGNKVRVCKKCGATIEKEYEAA